MQSDTHLAAPRPKSAGWFPWLLRKAISAALTIAVALIVIAALGLAQRIGWISSGGVTEIVNEGEADHVYTCPMHPQIRQPGPERCPICGMELVPASSSTAGDLDELSVKIQAAQRRLSNIQTEVAKQEPVFATIHTIGAVAIDESRMATIASYIDGRLERLFADYTGVQVAKGDHLAVIYSPELYSAQVEYLETRNSLSDSPASLATERRMRQKLVANSRQKLVELGMRPDQVAELEKSGKAQIRLTVYSPIGGTVIEKTAMEGKYIKAGEPIYRVADLSMVWLMLELYPEDAAKIRFGQRVRAEMSSIPGEVFHGRVAFIDPVVNPQKRTVGVRVEFLNQDGQLRPGDYADATISVPIGAKGEVYDADLAGKWISPMHPQIITDAPGVCPVCGMDLVPTSQYGYSDVPVEQPASTYVPRSALLMAGTDSVVYVEEEPGRFEIRPVVVGPILRDRVIILDGLAAGEVVATDGNFLIDSQMQLAGKPSLIDPDRAVLATGDGQEPSNEPLQLQATPLIAVPGAPGQQLESLFETYFTIQQTLAGDKKPSDADAVKLHQLALRLQSTGSLPARVQEKLVQIVRHSEHLHHLDLDKARHDAFRPISHAIVPLAALVRGETATQSFHHMFCPMVKGGAGDWLQADPKLTNPYWGSQMLHCGEVVRQLPPTRGLDESKAERPKGHDATHQRAAGAAPG